MAGLAVVLSLAPIPEARGADGSVVVRAGGERQAHRWAGRQPGRPAYLWLRYSDGGSQTEDCPYGTGIKPPAFKCTYGTSIDDCKRQVQSELDAVYADFNLVFTLSQPPTGDFYSVFITSDPSWCQVSSTSTEAGVAFFNCNDNPGQTAYAFECGYSAHACATLIAHEHAHLVGLEHTILTTDVMNQYVLASADGFQDQSSRTVDAMCQGTQNSYQQMLAALGPWPGGEKPSAFSPIPDAAAVVPSPDASPDVVTDASGGGVVGYPPGGSSDDGGVVAVAGYDALVRPPIPTAGTTGSGGSSAGGCSLDSQPASGAAVILALACALAAAATRDRRRCRSGRRARPANERLPCAGPRRWPSPFRARDPR